jgi:hypothetical protein
MYRDMGMTYLAGEGGGGDPGAGMTAFRAPSRPAIRHGPTSIRAAPVAGAVAGPLTVEAQRMAKVYRIGVLDPTSVALTGPV